VGFEPTIPASERAKTVHALDRSATVTGPRGFTKYKYKSVITNFVTYLDFATRFVYTQR
jgi:hypothetical protein